MLRVIFIAIFREYLYFKTAQRYYTALSIVNAEIYTRTACVLFKYPCVVLYLKYVKISIIQDIYSNHMQKTSLNCDITASFNVSVQSYMLFFCVYNKND
jgi:hypothetical protein